MVTLACYSFTSVMDCDHERRRNSTHLDNFSTLDAGAVIGHFVSRTWVPVIVIIDRRWRYRISEYEFFSRRFVPNRWICGKRKYQTIKKLTTLTYFSLDCFQLHPYVVNHYYIFLYYIYYILYIYILLYIPSYIPITRMFVSYWNFLNI